MSLNLSALRLPAMDTDRLLQHARLLWPIPLACLGLYTVYSTLRSAPPQPGTIIPSPALQIAALPRSEQEAQSYPPDLLPGRLDTPTPYGSIRSNEFGPPSGPRVLLIHGISTPSIALAGLAHALADSGYRVLLFDLFGRGYSASPAAPQDAALFASQIHLVLAASPLPWPRFRVVGYSLGGGIAADFASWFPRRVESLVLIAPSGLVRETRISWRSRVLYGGWVPRRIAEWAVRRRLGAPETRARDAAHPALMPDSEAEVGRARIADVVAWQTRVNAGFAGAFVSSLRYAPISGQHARWRVVAERLAAQRAGGSVGDEGMWRGQVLMVLGRDDAVIVAEELVPDARAIFGDDGLVVREVGAGHDLVVVKAVEVADLILDFWED